MPSTTPSWQLQSPVHAVVFDCDGTLSAIEGIDELAEQNHVGDAVKALTAEAMNKTGINPALYRKRLELVSPSKSQVEKLGRYYYETCVPDVNAVIQCLQRLGKEVFVISAGLAPAVTLFAELLNIPRSHALSVDIKFDEHGRYQDFDTASPFTMHDGKRQVVAELQNKFQSVAHIGDGMNDLVAHDMSTRFIGYGGIHYRKNIAAECGYYIRTPSVAALLPLVLTQDEVGGLLPAEIEIYSRGVEAIEMGLVDINL